MAKRMLDCCASDFAQFTKADLLESIQKSEGRVIACETIGSVQPLLGNVTNAEFAASMGADILLLNLFDVQQPVIHGLPPVEPGGDHPPAEKAHRAAHRHQSGARGG